MYLLIFPTFTVFTYQTHNFSLKFEFFIGRKGNTNKGFSVYNQRYYRFRYQFVKKFETIRNLTNRFHSVRWFMYTFSFFKSIFHFFFFLRWRPPNHSNNYRRFFKKKYYSLSLRYLTNVWQHTVVLFVSCSYTISFQVREVLSEEDGRFKTEKQERGLLVPFAKRLPRVAVIRTR